jgi:hypothetical protein
LEYKRDGEPFPKGAICCELFKEDKKLLPFIKGD